MADRMELLMEAERRGILPPDQQGLLNEARNRGLVPGGQTPEIQAPDVPQISAPEPRRRGGSEGQTVAPLQALGVLDDFVRSLASGATFGFADEIAAGAGSLVGDETFEERLAAERARDKAISPAVRLPGEIAGGIAGAIAAPLAAPAAAVNIGRAGLQALPNILRAPAIGAATGGLAGAGFAEGDRTEGALTGAGIGALGGAIVPPALRAVQGFSSGVRNALSGRAGVDERALQRIQRAVQTTPERLAARQAMSPGAPLADVADEGVRGLAGTVARTPGPGQQAARNLTRARNVRTGTRLRDLVQRTVSGDDFQGTLDDVVATRRTEAQRLYNAAFDENPTVNSAIIDRILASRQGQQALRQAQSFPEFANAPVNDIRLLDQVYKTIGGRARAAGRSGDTQLSNNLNDLRTSLRMAMPRRYREALTQYSDDSAMVDALENGRNFILQNSAGRGINTNAINQMSEGERDLFLMGASEGMQEMIAATPDRQVQTMLRKLFGSRAIRDRMARVFPNKDAFNRFRKGIIQEAQATETSRQVLGGSPTQERLAAGAEAVKSLGVAFDVGRAAVRGDIGDLATRAVRSISSRLPVNRIPAAESETLARMLFDPAQAAATAQRLTGGATRDALSAARTSTLRNQAAQFLTPGIAVGGAGFGRPEAAVEINNPFAAPGSVDDLIFRQGFGR